MPPIADEPSRRPIGQSVVDPARAAWLRTAWLVLLMLATAAWIGSYPLMQPDEGRNAEVAREMAASGDFIVPRLNGLVYVDKPFLHFAIVAVSLEVFGVNEFAARFPSVIFTALTALLIGWFGGRVWGPDVGWAAAAMSLAAPLTFAMAHVVILDSLLALLVVASIISFYLAIEARAAGQGGAGGPTPWRRWSLSAWVLIGLGILTKGPVAFLLPLLVGIPYAVHRRALRAVFYLPAIVLMVVVVTPWVVMMSRAMPDYVHYVAVTETWQRVTTDKLRRTQPFWFFIPILICGTLPWALMAIAGLWRRRRAKPQASDPRLRFLLLWIVLPFVFFSLSRGKLPHYMLPLIPAVALLAAVFAVGGDRNAAPPGRLSSAILFCVIGSVALVASFFTPKGDLLDPATLAAARTFLRLFGLAAVVVGGYGLLRKPTGAALVMAFSLPLIVMGFAFGPILKAVGDSRSAKGLAVEIRKQVPGTPRVVAIGTFPTSLPFYLGAPLEIASKAGNELTSNYVRAEYASLVAAPGSKLHPADWWRPVLAECKEPTVFVVSVSNDAVAAELQAAGLALIDDDRKYEVYGPCRSAGRPAD